MEGVEQYYTAEEQEVKKCIKCKQSKTWGEYYYGRNVCKSCFPLSTKKFKDKRKKKKRKNKKILNEIINNIMEIEECDKLKADYLLFDFKQKINKAINDFIKVFGEMGVERTIENRRKYNTSFEEFFSNHEGVKEIILSWREKYSLTDKRLRFLSDNYLYIQNGKIKVNIYSMLKKTLQ